MPKYEVGRYEVEIIGQGFQKAGTGSMQLVIQFKVLGKVDPRDPQSLIAVAPGERKFYRTITENTLTWVMEDLKAMGVEGLTSWAQLDPTIAPDGFVDLTGKTLDLMCGSKLGLDSKSYEDWSVARDGAAGKPIENAAATEVKALDRLFGKHLKKTPAAQGRRGPVPVAAAQPSQGGVITDDDVPF